MDTIDEDLIHDALVQNVDEEDSVGIDEEELCCRGEEVDRMPNSASIYEELYLRMREISKKDIPTRLMEQNR